MPHATRPPRFESLRSQVKGKPEKVNGLNGVESVPTQKDDDHDPRDRRPVRRLVGPNE